MNEIVKTLISVQLDNDVYKINDDRIIHTDRKTP